MTQLGMGVMIQMLGGNAETIDAIKAAKDKVIKSAVLKDDKLTLTLEDGGRLNLWDGGQSCCESRYVTTDDDLSKFAGSTLMGFELRDGPSSTDKEYGEVHDSQFLDVRTSLGVFTLVTHVEHNGYYGGFWIEAKYTAPEVSP